MTHRYLAGALLSLVLLSVVAGAQNPRVPPPPPPTVPAEQNPGAEDEATAKMQRDLSKKANQERQAALKKDTEKLLKLATELKDYVDKTNENMLSMDVIKKAEEIEKLAHSVKDKMKGN